MVAEMIASLVFYTKAIYQKVIPPLPTPTPFVRIFPTPTQKVIPKVQGISTQTSEPIVDCVGPDGKWIKMTKPECVKFNAAWGKRAVTKDDLEAVSAKYANQNSNPIVPLAPVRPTYNYIPKSYYPCKIYYPNSNQYSIYDHLYETKAECDTYQAQIDSLFKATPTTTQVVIPSARPTYSVEECRGKVLYRYAPVIQSCSVLFGSGSSQEGCIEIYTKQRNSEMATCDTSYSPQTISMPHMEPKKECLPVARTGTQICVCTDSNGNRSNCNP